MREDYHTISCRNKRSGANSKKKILQYHSEEICNIIEDFINVDGYIPEYEPHIGVRIIVIAHSGDGTDYDRKVDYVLNINKFNN